LLEPSYFFYASKASCVMHAAATMNSE